MYGPPAEAMRRRFDELPLEELKTIPMSPETAKVHANSDMHYTGEYKEQILMDTEGVIAGRYQKWITERSLDAWVKIDFKGKPYTICGVGIKSADDCPGRDPTSVKISRWDMDDEKFV